MIINLFKSSVNSLNGRAKAVVKMNMQSAVFIIFEKNTFNFPEKRGESD